MLDKRSYMHACTSYDHEPCFPPPHTHARRRARTSTSTQPLVHTHAEKYAIGVTIASTRQKWFRERASLLRYMYIAFRVECAQDFSGK
jgi:hypothetical protein